MKPAGRVDPNAPEAAGMICTRCNKISSDAGRCPTCGTPLKPLASLQRRGWVAFGAGAFLSILIVALWIWVDVIFTASGAPRSDPEAARFLGRLNVTFGLVFVAGMLGAVNGWMMARSGLRNLPLMLGMVIVFVAALCVGFTASNGYQPQ